MISSAGNSQVKLVASLTKKAKVRNELGLFVVEGPKMFWEAPRDRVEKVYATERFLAQHDTLERDYAVELVTEDVLRAMSDTKTPQGVLALVRRYSYSMEDILRHSRPLFLMILETIQDPGNLGTIVRAGEGAGVSGIIMDSATVDIYNPKVIRSTMGSVYRVPFMYTDNLRSVLTDLKKLKIKLFAAHLKGENNYEEEDYTGDIGFLIGNEANGLTEKISAMADRYVLIPIAGKVESLNAAVASAVLMFEASRQRRCKRL